MPWMLTTPYSGGDLDPTGIYDQVKIRRMTWDDFRKLIDVSLEYGSTIAGAWVPGMTPYGKAGCRACS